MGAILARGRCAAHVRCRLCGARGLWRRMDARGDVRRRCTGAHTGGDACAEAMTVETAHGAAHRFAHHRNTEMTGRGRERPGAGTTCGEITREGFAPCLTQS